MCIRDRIYPQSKPETEYVLPSTVKTIEYSAFSGCNNIEKIVLNNGLEEIMGNAFYNCTCLLYTSPYVKTYSIPADLQVCY